jgi:hypothetical protein
MRHEARDLAEDEGQHEGPQAALFAPSLDHPVTSGAESPRGGIVYYTRSKAIVLLFDWTTALTHFSYIMRAFTILAVAACAGVSAFVPQGTLAPVRSSGGMSMMAAKRVGTTSTSTVHA